ncbi:MAG: glycosyltransferase, partial [Prolixibacteraceae bacterium]|nr:glycosyltransferase [Prolixibacteraceae bacterium]
MISIIIASVNPQLKKQITENIAKTIGCNYELLITDNSKNPRGLCKLYNLSAGEAKYPYLIFVHEDIIFHTHNWGKILIESLNLPLIGLVGSAGTTYKSKQLSSWIDVPSYLYRSNIIQTDTAKPTTRIRNNNSHTSQVSILVGMLLAIIKTTWEKYN